VEKLPFATTVSLDTIDHSFGVENGMFVSDISSPDIFF
jgi:hypothetical protein